MSTKFKVGDRIRAFGVANSYMVAIGTINEIYEDGRLVCPGFIAHPKQCRKLVKRAPLRRIWVLDFDVNTVLTGPKNARHSTISSTKMVNDDIEFVEVRKKRCDSSTKN